VDNNYLDLGMSKSGFIHTLPSGRLRCNHRSQQDLVHAEPGMLSQVYSVCLTLQTKLAILKRNANLTFPAIRE
jgi:hypothetical protein